MAKGKIVTFTVPAGEEIELPQGARLTSDGWRLRDGSLYVFVRLPASGQEEEG